MEKFKSFITEEEKEPYRLLILVYDTPDDPNKTGVIIEKESKKIDGVEVYQFEVNLGYPTYNEKGNIVPEKVIKTLKDHGAKDPYLTLELSFREREPVDSHIEEVLKESVDYWRTFL